jgi:hypothetical protein
MNKVWLPVFVLVIIACVLAAACTGNPDKNPVPTITTFGNNVDLTNQKSPQAATFRNGASFTPLVTPQPLIRLEKVAGGFSSPMMIAVPPDDSGRLFVVDQIGVVKIITPDKNVVDTPFLDVRDRMVRLNTAYDERGLFSIAFHPDYKDNGRVLSTILRLFSLERQLAGAVPIVYPNSGLCHKIPTGST